MSMKSYDRQNRWFKRYVLSFLGFLGVSLLLVSVNLQVPPDTILDQCVLTKEQTYRFNVSRGTISLYMFTEDIVEREVAFAIIGLPRNETVSDGVYEIVPETTNISMGRLLIIRGLPEGEYAITVLLRDAPSQYRYTLLITEYLVSPSAFDIYFWAGLLYMIVSGSLAILFFRDPEFNKDETFNILDEQNFKLYDEQATLVTMALFVTLLTIATWAFACLVLISIII